MDVQSGVFRFEQAISGFPQRIRDVLRALPDSVKGSASEVRLRVDQPLMLTCPGQNWFVDASSRLSNIPRGCLCITPQDISDAVVAMCSYSVHSHENEMKNGFISLRGGHRAGICGTAVITDGKISALREITSINLRIARDIRGAADEVLNRAFRENLGGVLIAGPPSSGKTTILRDLARQLSSGKAGRYLKVAVIDERGELGAVFEGIPQNDLGPCCDILSGYPKGEGILMAVRTLSPQVIICDEIGGGEEISSMLDGLRCGVRMVVSAHAGSLEELLGKSQITRLLLEGAFSRIVVLGGADQPGRVEEMVRVEDLRYENGRFVAHCPILFHDGNLHGLEFVGASSQT
ncbi:MAG: stage III sporulation protein AA [Oscillospiraceae bacterium]|jgi:stage III sporulation protein AA